MASPSAGMGRAIFNSASTLPRSIGETNFSVYTNHRSREDKGIRPSDGRPTFLPFPPSTVTGAFLDRSFQEWRSTRRVSNRTMSKGNVLVPPDPEDWRLLTTKSSSFSTEQFINTFTPPA